MRFVVGGALALLASIAVVYTFWVRPTVDAPLAQPLSLPTTAAATTLKESIESPLQAAQPIRGPEKDEASKPVCGDVTEMTALLIGIDYRGDDYLYGLSDVVRVVQIDFVDPHVNVVALPRDLLVVFPEESFDIPGPIKLAQAYLFGTPGLNHYLGDANGAGASAAVIQHNFGIRAEHYLVINFRAFTDFIDEIGGIEVDLPQQIYGPDNFFLPAGNQTINGTQALLLARIRYGYGEPFRIDSQALIMKAVLARVKEPLVLLRLPEILADFRSAIITDLSPSQIGDALCFLRHLNLDDILFFNPDREVLEQGWEFLPSLNGYSWIWRWDGQFLDWLEVSMYSQSQEIE